MAVGTCLRHHALLYDSPDDFVAAMAPFAREGLEGDNPVFVATAAANVVALREELGDDAERVDLNDTTEWQAHPYGRLQAFRALADGVRSGGTLYAMGEPVWRGSEAAIRQWARYESLINLALADAPMRFVCLYDAAGLPDRILDYALQTHPEQVRGTETVPTDRFVPPHEFRVGSPPTPGDGARELPLDAVADFRRALADYARSTGLRDDRVDELVMAANEVATNALLHGEAPRCARAWCEDGELVCQVVDGGSGLHDPLAGWVPPEDVGNGGWGLPIARQLCDVVDIAPTPPGTIVSLHLSLEA
jgi:anti-sigma regulatory factor (Ser/Thr protein kinase)